MILNNQTRRDIAQQWAAVRKLCSDSHRQWQSEGSFINETPPESFYNLPFLLAYAILDQVLLELIRQNAFQCRKSAMLGEKMAKSVNALSWNDYAVVESGKEERNDLAHHANLLGKTDCFRFIDAIEKELKVWNVL